MGYKVHHLHVHHLHLPVYTGNGDSRLAYFEYLLYRTPIRCFEVCTYTPFCSFKYEVRVNGT